MGRRPTAVALSPDAGQAYVADTHGDRIAIVDLKADKVSGVVALGSGGKLSMAERGELLFYDARAFNERTLPMYSADWQSSSNTKRD